MPENHQPEQLKNTPNSIDEEIELIDLLCILWKWKYLIIGGTLLCTIAAIIISLNMTKIYSVETILEPGILNITSSGAGEEQRVYVDSSQKIKDLIDIGSFENQILDYLNAKNNHKNIPDKIKFKTNLQKNSAALKVSYETSNTDQGIIILDYLIKCLVKRYDQVTDLYRKNFYTDIQSKNEQIADTENQISRMKNEISILQSEKDSIPKEIAIKTATIAAKIKAKTDQIINSQTKLKDVNLDVERINKNTEYLIEERNKLLESKDNENFLPTLIYTNTIHQNIGYLNELKNAINQTNNEISEARSDINGLENEIRDLELQKESSIYQTKQKIATFQSQINNLEFRKSVLLDDIKLLEFKKKNVQNIQILKAPTKSLIPIKPKKRIIVISVTFIGLLMMICISFFTEYVAKYRRKIT